MRTPSWMSRCGFGATNSALAVAYTLPSGPSETMARIQICSRWQAMCQASDPVVLGACWPTVRQLQVDAHLPALYALDLCRAQNC